jgi:hypothetical protein
VGWLEDSDNPTAWLATLPRERCDFASINIQQCSMTISCFYNRTEGGTCGFHASQICQLQD